MQRERGSHVIFNYSSLMFLWAADFWCSASNVPHLWNLLSLSSAHLTHPTHLPSLCMCVSVLKSSHCIRKSSLSGLLIKHVKKPLIWHSVTLMRNSAGYEALSTPNSIIKHIIICRGIFKWLMMKAERKGGRLPCLETFRKGMNKSLSWFDLRGNHFRDEQSPDANMSAGLLKLCHDELYRQLKTGQINTNSVGAIF